jgi:hypothetical protein
MPGHPGSCQQQFSLSGIKKIVPACQVDQSTAGQVLSQSVRIQMPGIMVSKHEIDTQPSSQRAKCIGQPLSTVLLVHDVTTQADHVRRELVHLLTDLLVIMFPHLV